MHSSTFPSIFLLHILSSAFVFCVSQVIPGNGAFNVLQETFQNVLPGAPGGGSSTLEPYANARNGITDAFESMANTFGANPIANVLTKYPIMNDGRNIVAIMFDSMSPDDTDRVLEFINGNATLLELAKKMLGQESVDPTSVVPINFDDLIVVFNQMASQFTASNGMNLGMFEDLLKALPVGAFSTFLNHGAIWKMMSGGNVANPNLLNFMGIIGNAISGQKVTATREFDVMNVKPASLEKSSNSHMKESANDADSPDAVKRAESVVDDAAVPVPVVEDADDLSSSDDVPLEALENALSDFLSQLASLRSTRTAINLVESVLQSVATDPNFLDDLLLLSTSDDGRKEANFIVAELSQLVPPELFITAEIGDLFDTEGNANIKAVSKLMQSITENPEATSASEHILEQVQNAFQNLLSRPAEGYSYGTESNLLDKFFNADDTINSVFVSTVASDILSAFETNGNAVENFVSEITSIAEAVNRTYPTGPHGAVVKNVVESLLGEGGILADADISSFVTDSGGVIVDSVSKALAGADFGDIQEVLESMGLRAPNDISVGEAVKLLADSISIDANGIVSVNKIPLGLIDSEDTLLLKPIGASAVQNPINSEGFGEYALGNAFLANNIRGASGNAAGSILGDSGNDFSPMESVAQAVNGVMARTNDPFKNVAGSALGNGSGMKNVAKTVADSVANGSIHSLSDNGFGNGSVGRFMNSKPLGADSPIGNIALGNVAEKLGVGSNANELLSLAKVLNLTSNSTVDDVIKSLNAANGSVIERVKKATGFHAGVMRGNQRKLASAFLLSLSKFRV